MLNKVILIGRLTRDPEMRFTSNGIPVTTFSLAVNRPFQNKQGEKETDFIDIVAWRQLGELCANYLHKGRMAAVEGRLEIQTYETQDGQKRKATRVVAQNVQFLSPRDAGSGSKSSSIAEELGSEVEIPGEEIPF
ncbi:MAG: single-stranded DNA-binding protein [Syntrophomonadaceae bacterium]|nr:single-stranded DNA-binding protein [Syntrophomonadaceae bacterium]